MENDMELLVVLLIMVILWLMPSLPRLIFGWLARRARKRMEDYFNDAGQGGAANCPQQQSPRSRKKVDNTIGEYVDYEEIKE
jgi:hypothetical protein